MEYWLHKDGLCVLRPLEYPDVHPSAEIRQESFDKKGKNKYNVHIVSQLNSKEAQPPIKMFLSLTFLTLHLFSSVHYLSMLLATPVQLLSCRNKTGRY